MLRRTHRLGQKFENARGVGRFFPPTLITPRMMAGIPVGHGSRSAEGGPVSVSGSVVDTDSAGGNQSSFTFSSQSLGAAAGS
jgi:hypothetical protein